MDLLKQKEWFDSAEFEQNYHCEMPLGVVCGKDGTRFRLWAPTAEAVTLHLYPSGDNSQAIQSVCLVRGERGLWSYETKQNLDGYYYDFDVTTARKTYRTADPYARACGVNGQRSMVLDLRRTDPPLWNQDKAPALGTEQIIYELHIKDFSWDPAGGFHPADRGRYKALCRTGTTLCGDGIHPTGLDYLKRLGVTHIQLMPVYDYGSVDEAGAADQFNWGYDPVNYNIPEGSYSSDPYHGEVRIRELKQAIAALHRSGLRVVMDVVYNHTYALDSWLWRTVPWYYYRQNADGTPSNGSGCGNELATERSMCAKYILDSVLYWAEEYHLDGFRFDLMGLLDVPLMNRIRQALDEKFGAGEKLVYGEPWAAAGSAVRPGTRLANKAHLRELSPGIAAFCDNTRDAVKGNVMDERSVGFVNGGFVSGPYLHDCITGWAMAEHDAPSQTITYLSCHDDWTLWDKLVCTMSPQKKFREPLSEVLRANRLAAAINLCCQGYPFLHAGEEFARTKDGVKNSYRSSPMINRLDWRRAVENQGLVDYYRGLIALRKRLPCLCDKTPQASARVSAGMELAPGCIGLCLDNRGGSAWREIFLIFNTSQNVRDITLPDGTWQILVDAQSSFCWNDARTLRKTTRIPPVSALILGSCPE